MKICENLKEGNSNHHERFLGQRANISARYNDWKSVAIFGQDVPIRLGLTYWYNPDWYYIYSIFKPFLFKILLKEIQMLIVTEIID